jgi:hypothetical protein
VIIPLATKEHSFSYCSVQSNLGSLIIWTIASLIIWTIASLMCL